MKFKLLLIFTFLTVSYTYSQKLIAVQNGSTPSFYETADEAFDNAIEGDTLYFPGGTFNVNRTIDKRLHIIGTGHNPNSTTATGSTIFANGSTPQLVYVSGGGGTVSGIAFSSLGCSGATCANIRIDENIDGLVVDRVNMVNGFVGTEGVVKSLFLTRSIMNRFFIQEINGISPTGLISNNIIYARTSFASNLNIEFNVFSEYNLYHHVLTVENCSVINNIFLDNNSPVSNSSYSSFRNNFGVVMTGVSGTNYGSSNQHDPNVDNTYGQSIFINYLNINSFYQYDFDLHLVNDSPLLTASSSGGQIGIYGGRYPWKDDSIPFNPHVVSKSISGNTNENGELPVSIEVEAQQH